MAYHKYGFKPQMAVAEQLLLHDKYLCHKHTKTEINIFCIRYMHQLFQQM